MTSMAPRRYAVPNNKTRQSTTKHISPPDYRLLASPPPLPEGSKRWLVCVTTNHLYLPAANQPNNPDTWLTSGMLMTRSTLPCFMYSTTFGRGVPSRAVVLPEPLQSWGFANVFVGTCQYVAFRLPPRNRQDAFRLQPRQHQVAFR